jgi:TolA-binding protein
MALPAAIKKQVAEANRLHKSTYQPEGDDPEAGLQGAPEPEVVEPEGTQPEPKQETRAPAQDDDDKWETRYRVLQGKYNAEVPVLQRQNRDLADRIDQMEQLLTTMRSAPQAAQPAQNTGASLVSDEEIADYGPEFMDMVGRMARQVNQDQISKLNETIAQLQNQLQNVGGKVQKTEQESIYGQLDKNVENWREINRDPQFLEWLATRDPFSGLVRRDMLQEAFKRADAPRVIAFFNGFLREHAAVTEGDRSGPGKKKPDTGNGLDKLVAPGRQRTGSVNQTGARDGKRTWTEAEITQFYAEKRRGAYKGNEKLMQQLESDIFAAQRDGRIDFAPRVPHSNAAY